MSRITKFQNIAQGYGEGVPGVYTFVQQHESWDCCRYSVTAAAVVQELQRAHMKMRHQSRQCLNLHALLLAQNIVSCCVHKRQRRECDDLYLETVSASVRCDICLSYQQFLLCNLTALTALPEPAEFIRTYACYV